MKTSLRITALIAGLATPLPAAAGETDHELIHLTYEGLVLEAFAWDSGWVPDPSADVRVRFGASVDGDVAVDMWGTHWLAWPEAFQFNLVGNVDEGHISVDYGLDLTLQLEYDLGVLGSGSYDVPIDEWLTGITNVVAAATFTPFLLLYEDPVEFEAEHSTIQLIEGVIPIATGIALEISLNMEPELSCDFHGDEIDVGYGVTMTLEDTPVTLPYEASGTLAIPVAYDGTLYCVFNISLVPVLSLCIGTCFDIDLFELDIPVTDDSQLLDFDPVEVTHTYPVLDVDTRTLNFGEVEVGREAFMDLPIRNTGNGYLEVEFSMEDWDEGFSFFPIDGIVIPGGEERIVRIWFSPAAEYDFETVLHVSSNAPDENEVDVLLTGSGGSTEPDVTDADTDPCDCDDCSRRTSACGCRLAGTGAPATGALLLLAAALAALAFRRRA
jgi:hypothetical protein